MLALRPDVPVAERWRSVRHQALASNDERVRQLLPLVHRRLVEAGLDGPEVADVGVSARETWLRNRGLFLEVERAVGVLEDAGVVTLALKGVPLALAHYPAVSLRPMGDFDVLVSPEAAPAAVSALRRAGWTVERDLRPDVVRRTSETVCQSPGGRSDLDLHWRLVPWVGRSWWESDPALWAQAAPIAIGGRTMLVPASDDLLLHVLLHAFRSGWERVPRWVADVAMLLRSTGTALDWDRFTRRVVDGHLTIPVGEGLNYVAATLDEDIPPSVLTALAQARTTRRERHKHRLARRAITYERHWLTGQGRGMRTRWSRISINYGRRAAALSLPPFLRATFRVDRVWTLPFVLPMRRLRPRVSGGRSRPNP